ncbi:unnamed protein product [Symbiodinium sp. CCMP2592]|nr:unnamed protein product [Symbiodinium sp. CCMP2592]
MAAHPAISSVLFALGQKVRTSNVGGVISKADLLDVIVVFCDSEASASNAVQRTREVVQRRVNRWLKTNSPERAGYLHIVDGLRAPLSVEYFGPDVVVEVLRHFGAVITDESRGDFVHRMQGSDSATGAGEDAPGRYLTVPSTVALALRRNLSNVSCADLGLVILDDASRWSVSRSEVRAGAAATASMREWHAGMLQEMFHPDGAEDFNLSLHIVSQDATNSGIWQKRKLIALLCHSAYLVSLPSKFRWSWHDMFREIRTIADVQPVEDGPNEVLARKIWQCVSSACEHVVVLGSDCLEHAAHLVTVSSLKLVDKLLPLQFEGKGRAWKYFSSLATFSITVRDSSKDFFQMWCQEHGDLSGVKHAKSLWPKCVAGRWNSCSDVERRMHDSGGQATVLPVMRRLMGAKREAAPAKEHQSIDEIAVEETAHYTQQMDRWRATTLKCVEDPLWWTVAEAMRMARSPALHLSVPRGLQSAACIVTLCGCVAVAMQCL